MTSDVEPIEFLSSFLTLPAVCYEKSRPDGASAPTLIAFNDALAANLGLRPNALKLQQKLNVFSGNALPPSANPVAMAYAGHQFGHFSPQLGDGRAHLIGELDNQAGQRFDVQLKGSGRTPFSRGGDGRSALGPVIREYLVSEAMHTLGVPTTRALAAVATGEQVFRETPEPGGILTRVAASHLRIGTLQFFAARGATDVVAALVSFALERHYSDIDTDESDALRLFKAVAARQANLVAHWMSLGFIHGVMNTDNMSLSGETIDYGPCAFMDEYRADKVFSAIDRGGRYAYSQQPLIAQWNLARLAECLLLLDDRQALFEEVLSKFRLQCQTHFVSRMHSKLGLAKSVATDASLIDEWLAMMEAESADFTVTFRELADALERNTPTSDHPAYLRWWQRVTEQDAPRASIAQSLRATNPAVIPRNHQIAAVIQAAYEGDYAPFHRLHDVLGRPFESTEASRPYELPPRDSERVRQTFCGT
ncbi:MAG: YdiU family protein [Pseudomonadota bacterium]